MQLSVRLSGGTEVQLSYIYAVISEVIRRDRSTVIIYLCSYQRGYQEGLKYSYHISMQLSVRLSGGTEVQLSYIYAVISEVIRRDWSMDDDEILRINVTSKAFLALLGVVITEMFYIGREVVTRRDLASGSELTDFRRDIKLKIDKETKD